MNNDSNAQLDTITGIGQADDSQAGNMVRMHAALVGNTLRKIMRIRPPVTTNHGQTLLCLSDGVTPQPFFAKHPTPRSIIVRNLCNVPAVIWEGSSMQGPPDYIVPALSFMAFPVDAGVLVYTIACANGNPATNGGVCYVDLTDQVLTPASGSFGTALGSTPQNPSNQAAAAAANTATIPAGSDGRTNYITGFNLSSAAAAATVSGLVTVSGILGGSDFYQFVETTSGGVLNIQYPQPVQATGPNTAITVSLAAITGGAATALNVQGYRL